MRGIVAASGYLPRHRLQRSAIREALAAGGGSGTRAVASYDEDSTTMGFEAARLALRSAPEGLTPSVLSFATTAPAYTDRTNATAIHAALRLPPEVTAFDAAGSVRSWSGLITTALHSTQSHLVVGADIRVGLPGSVDESSGGDAASALVIGDEATGPVVAECLGSASITDEFVDRWRTPGQSHSKLWEDRFGETRYLELGQEGWKRVLAAADVAPADVDGVIVTGLHQRANGSVARRLDVEHAVDDLAGTVGNTGAAHPGLLLASALEAAAPGQTVALVVLSDGADVFVFRTTEAIAAYRPARSVTDQLPGGLDVPYAKFLSWRGMLTLEPPRRPEPGRTSASAASRSKDWKFGLVGSRDRETGTEHLPPARVSRQGGAVDDMEPLPMADREGTIATFTVDRMVYSPSPPVVFAVVDFDGGGRLPVELTDVEADSVAIGDRVEMTFRRMFTADGLHNYFWKARPVRA